MHALEFLLNGERVCVAAPGDDGLVMSNVAMTSSLETSGTCDVYLRVGGVQNEHHLEWFRRSLALGDVIEIRFIDAAQSDPPVSIKPVTDAERERLRIASNEKAV
jgi:hypothetical protein